MAPGGDEVALHPVVKVLWRIQTLLVAGAGAFVMVTAAAVVDGPVLLRAGLLGAAAAGIALAFWLPGLHYRAWGYRLDDKALELHHGIFTVRHSLVPYFRVQHVDVSQDLAVAGLTGAKQLVMIALLAPGSQLLDDLPSGTIERLLGLVPTGPASPSWRWSPSWLGSHWPSWPSSSPTSTSR